MLLLSVRSSPSALALPGRTFQRWLPGVVAWAVWLLAGFVVAFVVLRWSAQSIASPLPLAAPAPVAADVQAVARALGARPAQVLQVQQTAAAPSRYSLTGVVAPVVGGQPYGVALIAIDGQRPSPYRVGAVLDGRWRVEAVERRSVLLQATEAAGERTTLALPSPTP